MYFITTFTKYDILDSDFIEIGSSRTVGYYKNKKDAIDTVLENCGDLWEYNYTYAVVEYIGEGLYNEAYERWFFKWNMDTRQYEPIEPLVSNFGNYAFG